MVIQKCHVCDTVLYPGEKCYQVKIWIYSEGDEEGSMGELAEEDGTDSFLDEASLVDTLSLDTHCDHDASSQDPAQEIHLTLCKNCQTRFLNNPSIEANLIFVNRDSLTKMLH
jgi:hypothetical protein